VGRPTNPYESGSGILRRRCLFQYPRPPVPAHRHGSTHEHSARDLNHLSPLSLASPDASNDRLTFHAATRLSDGGCHTDALRLPVPPPAIIAAKVLGPTSTLGTNPPGYAAGLLRDVVTHQIWKKGLSIARPRGRGDPAEEYRRTLSAGGMGPVLQPLRGGARSPLGHLTRPLRNAVLARAHRLHQMSGAASTRTPARHKRLCRDPRQTSHDSIHTEARREGWLGGSRRTPRTSLAGRRKRSLQAARQPSGARPGRSPNLGMPVAAPPWRNDNPPSDSREHA